MTAEELAKKIVDAAKQYAANPDKGLPIWAAWEFAIAEGIKNVVQARADLIWKEVVEVTAREGNTKLSSFFAARSTEL